MSATLRNGVGLFVGIIALIVLGSVMLGFAMGDVPTDPADATVDNEYYTSDSLLSDAELEPRSGDIELSDSSDRTVVIATSYSRADIEPVTNALTAHGHEVRYHETGLQAISAPGVMIGGVQPAQPVDSTDESELLTMLEEADALVVIGDIPATADEVDGIERFVDAGGHIVVAADGFDGNTGSQKITDRFGITIGNGYLYNMANNDANFQRVLSSGTGPLSPAERIVHHQASPVRSGSGSDLVQTTDGTHYSETRDSETYATAVQQSNVLVIGDSDLFRTLNYNRGDNEQIIGYALDFVTSGPENPVDNLEPADPGPHDPAAPPEEVIEVED